MRRTIVCILLWVMVGACSENNTPSEDISTLESVPAAGFMSATEAGKAIATTKCFSCHSSDGKGVTPDVPNLAGQHRDYIVMAAKEYMTDERENDAMKQRLQSLTHTDLVNVAEYYASLEPVGPAVSEGGGGVESAGFEDAESEPDIDPVLAGAALAVDCEGCHGEGGNSTLPGTPTLAGQPVASTIAAMRAYKDGERDDEAMISLAQALSDQDVEYVATYYAVQAPLPRKVEVTIPEAAEGCDGCHGKDGNSSDPMTPSLAGQDAQYLVIATKSYKNGPRTHVLMSEIVSALSNQEISALATYYAMKEPKSQVVVKRRSTEEWAKICERCHGPGGRSSNPRFPNLAGQQEAYIVNALQNYQQKTRTASIMHAMSWPLDDTDIKNLAGYYSRKLPK